MTSGRSVLVSYCELAFQPSSTVYDRGMRAVAALVLIVIATSCRRDDRPVAAESFADRRAHHHTKLIKHGPSPQSFVDEQPPPGVEEVRYHSGELELKAWFAHPTTKRAPALIYFHSGFAFGRSDFEDVRPFVDAGFAVMAPMLRGENGNPGDYELYYGEVDDARAAVAWLRARPEVDPNHVYAFGHSAGGVISALVSFYPDTGLRISGSAGGLYGIGGVRGREPFDPRDRDEGLLRVPAPNADQFRVPHFGYVGADDQPARQGAEYAARLADEAHAPLTVEVLPGNHFTSLPAAVMKFLSRVQEDISANQPSGASRD
jgi:dienelactone hydrolase